MPALPFVSAPSANAILSDLRPTTLTAPALEHVNAFLDELLVSLIKAARSINPSHLRTRGVAAVFAADRDGGERSRSSVGALGHAAVGEAEVEIRGWYDSHPTACKGVSGFPPTGKGSGLAARADRKNELSLSAFPVHEAIELMRVKVTMFSTFAPQAPSQIAIDNVTKLWTGVGGDTSDETITPAGLWLTAVLEHVSEHTLTKLSQVVARDSSVTSAGIQDLYTALCEDDSVYGFFKHMDVKKQLEADINAETRNKRSQRSSATALPLATSPVSTPTAATFNSPHGSKTSLTSSAHADHRKSSMPTPSRPASEQMFKVKPSNSTSQIHKRSGSVLSVSTRQHTGDSSFDSPAKRFSSEKAEEDFDAFLRSGETMRVSLTPSRFSTFDNSPAASPMRSHDMRSYGLSVPPSSSETSLVSSSTQASTAESGRVGASHRQTAGRSWSSANRMPRDSAIQEREEEETHRQSVMELLTTEKKPLLEETLDIPAVTLASPPSSPDLSSPSTPAQTPLPQQTSLSQRVTSMTSVPTSDPGHSPNISPDVLPRTVRSASEGAHDLYTGGTVRQGNFAAQQLQSRQEDRDLVAFLATPPPVKSTAVFDDQPSLVRNKRPSFKNIMSRMKKDRTKDSPRVPTPSMPNLTQRSPSMEQGMLRSQKSSSSFASGSTVMALGISSADLPAESSTPLKPREVLRKPSLVRKWAQQVTAGDSQRNIGRRRGGSTPRSITPSLPTLTGGDDEELATTPQSSHQPASNASTSSHQRQSSTSSGQGLGLGGVDFPESFAFRPIAEDASEPSNDMGREEVVDSTEASPKDMDANRGREAALAQLTAKSPSLQSRPSSPKLVDNRPSSRSSFRDSPKVRSSPLHHRVLELAREGDDGSPVAVPLPQPLSSPVSPEVSSTLGSLVSVKGGVHTEPSEHSDLGKKADLPETPDASAPEGYLAMADLVPLRHLLDHATSARECQLLLDAILSQLGVPRTPHVGTVARPEDRVAAWLLAGREGPVGDSRAIGPRPMRSATNPRSPNGSRSPIGPRSPGSTSPVSRSPVSKRTPLTPDATMKSLPALPPVMHSNGNGNGPIVDLNNSVDPLVEEHDYQSKVKRRVDIDAEAAAVAAAVVRDRLVRQSSDRPITPVA